MPSSTERRLVVHRPTEQLCRVLRWDDEDGLVLLEPVPAAKSNCNSNNSNSNKPAAKRRGSRWTFEKDIVLVEEKAKARAAKIADGASRGSHVDHGVSFDAAKKRTNNAVTSSSPGGKPAANALRERDPTPYARRSAKLDDRVAFRTDTKRPQRGHGLFALKDVPKGTEIMRVRAACAVLMEHEANRHCGRCFVLLKDTKRNPVVCKGCGFSCCCDCVEAVEKDGVHRATCRLSKICAQRRPDGRGVGGEAVIRLVADCLARRKVGMIDDDEWDVLESLEGHDNEAGMIGLGDAALRECTLFINMVIGHRFKKEEVQTIYRRIARNSHPVHPNPKTMGPLGIALAIFPCAALVNHSCSPNSFFHTATNLPANGPTGLEYVLRTTRTVAAGQELCVSYIANHGGTEVSDRQKALESWGFQCACTRCQDDIEEAKLLEKNVRPQGATAMPHAVGVDLLKAVNTIYDRLARNRARESELHGSLEILSNALKFIGDCQEAVSRTLLRRLSTCTLECVVALGLTQEEILMSAHMYAGNALASLGDSGAIDMWLKQYMDARQLASSSSGSSKGMYLQIAIEAMRKAVETCIVYYGPHHPHSTHLRSRVSLGQLAIP